MCQLNLYIKTRKITLKPLNSNFDAFLALIRAGLWEKEARLLSYERISLLETLQLATEQGMVGVVTSGLEHVVDVIFPRAELLHFASLTLQIEQQNKAMNQFVAELVEKMRKDAICAILVKGQGVAQCYEKPLWRPSGDVDLLLIEENYQRAKSLLLPLSSSSKKEERYSQHLGMSIGLWYVEIHGTLRTGLSARVDQEVDAAQDCVFKEGNVRAWQDGETLVFLPAPTMALFCS